MKKFLRAAVEGTSLLGWTAGYLLAIYWLIDGQVERLLWMSLPWDWGLPMLLAGMLLLLLWSALPKWRRIETPDEIRWSANLPSRIGSYFNAIASPLFVCPSPSLVPEWLARHDYLRLAGALAVVALTLWMIRGGLKMAASEKRSVAVSAAGLQVGPETFAWPDIVAIASGFLELEGGADIVLANRAVRLTPDRHGPTGRALVGAVQRFSPGTTIREPRFQAAFGAA